MLNCHFEPVKVLIIRVSSLGDVVHNMPMAQDILRHFPHAQIDWVVEEAYVDLLRLSTGLQRIIPFALRRWRKSLFAKATRLEIAHFKAELQRDAYDYVFDTQGLLKTGWIMHWTRCTPNGKKYGLGNASEGSGYEPLSRLFHDHSVTLPARTHAVARARLVAASAYGYFPVEQDKLPPADFGLQPVAATEGAWIPAQPYAVFFHGTAGAAKKWPRSAWIELAQALSAQQRLILLPWGNLTELQEAQAIASALPQGTCQVLPKLSMLEAVQLASLASLVIGVDSGLTHIAAAYNRPTIELYCASPRWKTEGNWSANIINLGDLNQTPSVAEVLAALAQLPRLPLAQEQ